MATQTEDNATDATSPTPYSPQAGNQGLTLPPPSQGLPLGGPSGIQPPMRGPAGPPPNPVTPQPDFASIQRAIQQQQSLANNPLYALGQGFQGQNAQAGVLDQQMKLTQMIQQQRSSALQEQQMHQQSLDRNIDMMIKVRQGIETQQLPPEFADTIGPILEQQHNALFGEGSPYANQGLPAAPGSITEMLKKGSSGGVTIQNAIDAQRDATPEDMQAALLLAKRDQKDGIANATKYLDSRRQARLKAVEPTLTDHLGQLVTQLKAQSGGGTPTLEQVMQAANAELQRQPDSAVAQAYGGESKAFVQKALTGALKADSPFLKGLDIQVGPGDPTKLGLGSATGYLNRAIKEAGLNITPADIRTLPQAQQTKLQDRAVELAQADKVDEAAHQQYAGHLAVAQADRTLPIGDNPKYNSSAFINTDTFQPVNKRLRPMDLEGHPIVQVDAKAGQAIESLNGALQDISDLADLMKSKSSVPGYNVVEAITDLYKQKTGQTNTADAIRAYQLTKEKVVRAMTQARPSDTQINRVPFPDVDLTSGHVDGASSGLNKLKTIADILVGTRRSLVGLPGSEGDVQGKIANAIKEVEGRNSSEVAPAARADGRRRVLRDGDNAPYWIPTRDPLPKGYHEAK